MAVSRTRRLFGATATLRRALLTITAFLIAALPLSPSFAAGQDAAVAKELPCFHRGVAIHNMMNWATVDPAHPDRYVSPAFVGPNYETSDALLRHVSASGIDFIRLTIDPGPFLQFSGADREALYQHMKRVVEPGTFEILAGPNSVDLKTTTLEVTAQ